MQTHTHTHTHTMKQTHREIRTDTQTDSVTKRQTGKQRETERQVNRQAERDRETGKHTDRQTSARAKEGVRHTGLLSCLTRPGGQLSLRPWPWQRALRTAEGEGPWTRGFHGNASCRGNDDRERGRTAPAV